MANVSIGTVDRVLHNRGEVAEISKRKVLEIVEKTGYKPNLLARTLGANKRYTVMALLPQPDQDEYWNFASAGVADSYEEYNQYGITGSIVHFDLYDSNSFLHESSKVLAKGPDAILVAPVFNEEARSFAQQCDERKIPYVLINNNVSGATPVSFIGQDLYQSGKLAAELLSMNQPPNGEYAILHIYDDIHHSIHLAEKEKGYRDYFSDQQNNDRVISIDLKYGNNQHVEQELLTLLQRENLQGIFITTSKGASVVSATLKKHSQRHVRVVAYDLLQENLKYLNEGIIDFLINQNSRRQSHLGMMHLANLLIFQKRPSPSVLFPLEIITRQNLKTYLSNNSLI